MNKVMLIGNVGKEPEVRYVDRNVAVARFPLATTERAILCLTVLRFPTALIGITSSFGGVWLKWWRNMFIRAINFISRGG